jgi:geranylgeranylglycerol-phosphate geranylgeranyltransferase
MIIALIRLMRLYYSLPLSLGLLVIVSYIVGGDLDLVEVSMTVPFFALLSVISAGYVLNDICDVAVDAINCPNRMMPAGRVSRRAAIICSVLLFAMGLVLASFCGWGFLLVLAMISAGLVVYDIYSKRLGVFKDVLVAVLATSLYPLAFTLAKPVETTVLKSLFIFPVWLFLTALGYEMLKDICDIEGDSQITQRLSNSYCHSKRFEVSARIIIVAAGVLTILPFLLGYCKFIYLACSIVAIVLSLFSLKYPPGKAIRFIYAEVFLITAGSMVDLLVYGV